MIFCHLFYAEDLSGKKRGLESLDWSKKGVNLSNLLKYKFIIQIAIGVTATSMQNGMAKGALFFGPFSLIRDPGAR